LHGSKVIEIRNAGIDKGLASQQWLAGNDFDFILAVGDDTMDEEMFAVLPVSAYSVRVGIARTRARFTMREQSEVLPMLERLAEGERV
jgi:trehalose 6-phosphate synthase/phosphatase